METLTSKSRSAIARTCLTNPRAELELLVREMAPALLGELGVGAATILNAWSHPGRIRSEAAFAALGGVAPLPAWSGQRVRHRLNPHGDRQLNWALHSAVLSRMTWHDETKAYVARRTAQGLSRREIRRCLKRHLARRLFKLLERPAVAPSTAANPACSTRDPPARALNREQPTSRQTIPLQ